MDTSVLLLINVTIS